MVKIYISTNLVNQTFHVPDYETLVREYQQAYQKTDKISLDEVKKKLGRLWVIISGDRLYSSTSLSKNHENSGLLREVLK